MDEFLNALILNLICVINYKIFQAKQQKPTLRKMFKKNSNRPPIIVSLKKIPNGYKAVTPEVQALFITRKIIRTIYRPDLMQGGNMNLDHQGMGGGLTAGTIIQPPSHVTIPAFANWFDVEGIHQIQRQAFPQFFLTEDSNHELSFNCKDPKLYKYYRNVMLSMWRDNAKKHLSSTVCRRNLLGDVSSIIRIHAFLENWGLINFPSKQHAKGYLLKRPQKLECYVCLESQAEVYYLADVGQIFQICEGCYVNENYPQCLSKEEFTRIVSSQQSHPDAKVMNDQQILRSLEIVNGLPNGAPRDKEKDPWSVIQKEFPRKLLTISEFTKEDIVKNFLRIPLNYKMNANIFENNEDFTTNEQHQALQLNHQISIFQDFQNPIQISVALNYEKWKNNSQDSQNINRIFLAAEKHAKFLAKDQEDKIEELIKMIVEATFSKLELKSLFVYEYEKYIEESLQSKKRYLENNMAESLKQNLKYLEKMEISNKIGFNEHLEQAEDGAGRHNQNGNNLNN